jgi:tetratricopeptide (TPR) repeat protein
LPVGEFRERPAIEKLYRQALAHWRKTSPKEVGGVQDYRVAVQEVLGKQEKSSQRISLWERVVEDLPTLNNVLHLLSLYRTEGEKLQKGGQFEEAKTTFHRGLKHIEKVVHDPVFSASLTAETFSFTRNDEIKPDSPWYIRAKALADTLLVFGDQLDTLGMLADAEAAIRVSLLCGEELLRHQPDRDARTFYLLAWCHLKLGNLLREDHARHAEYVTAVRFYAEAIAAPKVELDKWLHLLHYRYNGACAAALAGCGQGENSARLGDKEYARLRGQALDWLRIDLEAWQQLLEIGCAIRKGGIEEAPLAGRRRDAALAGRPRLRRRARLGCAGQAAGSRTRKVAETLGRSRGAGATRRGAAENEKLRSALKHDCLRERKKSGR